MINSDEETGSTSSAPLIARLAAGKLAALTYEPALPSGAMARARPGSGNFALVVHGRSAHAGRNPEDGRNALVAAADLATRLHAARRKGLSINPARIEGGGPNNVVPDLAILHVNLRPATPADLARGRGAARRCGRCCHRGARGADRAPRRLQPPAQADRPRRASACSRWSGSAAAELGETLDWHDTGGVCDGNNIAACGVPVIDTMGARGGAIHSPQEFLEVPSLAARARLTALVLHRIDAGWAP